jgi:hypothetical protein
VVARADGGSPNRFANQGAEAAAGFGAEVAAPALRVPVGQVETDLTSAVETLGDVANMLVLAQQRRVTLYQLPER